MKPAVGLTVRFWGVRGSFPTPTPSHLGYGGNTSCIEVRSASGAQFIIDAGTGLRDLGIAMQDGAPQHEIRLLLTHFHGDHIHGLPFFLPLYDPAQRISICSGTPADESRAALEKLMAPPYFPLDLANMPGKRTYVQMGSAAMPVDGVNVSAFPLNHPQGAWGYRLEHQGAVVVHASDYEHGSPDVERILIDQAQDADLLIYDAQYTPEEYPSRLGWGHSTWAEAARVAREARVARLILFHHDPSHDDAAIDRIVSCAREVFPNVEAAREGAVIAVAR